LFQPKQNAPAVTACDAAAFCFGLMSLQFGVSVLSNAVAVLVVTVAKRTLTMEL